MAKIGKTAEFRGPAEKFNPCINHHKPLPQNMCHTHSWPQQKDSQYDVLINILASENYHCHHSYNEEEQINS